jgi:hypothetical protein
MANRRRKRKPAPESAATTTRWVRSRNPRRAIYAPGVSRRVSLAVASALSMSAACQPELVGVRLRFPSEETFLLSTTISVDVYDGTGVGDASPDAICRALSVDTAVAPAGLQPLASSNRTAACQLLDGGVSFDNLEVGRRVFFAEAVSSSSAILRGCTVADLGFLTAPGGDDAVAAQELGVSTLVDIQLATLPTYPGTTPACADVVAKCQENVPCE